MRAKSSPVEAKDAERNAGFLTKTEREYLLGEWAPGDSKPGEWTETQERSKRSDIKTRTRHAVADIALLRQHGDGDLIRTVMERDQSPDGGVPTFYEETLEHARYGLSEFMLRLVLDEEGADQFVASLEDMAWQELLGSVAEDAGAANNVQESHSEFIETFAQGINDYAEANNIPKEEMLNAIQMEIPD